METISLNSNQNSVACDERLRQMSYDFHGRDAVSFNADSVDYEYKDAQKCRDYFFEMLYCLYNGDYKDGFTVFGEEGAIKYDQAKKDLGLEMTYTIDKLKSSNYIDMFKNRLVYKKFPHDCLFDSSMQKQNYKYDHLDFVQGNKIHLTVQQDDGKIKPYELIGDEHGDYEMVPVDGTPVGNTHFERMKYFWPEGIITENGTFFMTPLTGQHEAVCKFLSLMGENMYNAIRVYNTNHFTTYDYMNNNSHMVRTGGANVGILFSCLTDYIPNDYSKFTVSEKQAETMLALYNISSKIYSADNKSRGIHFTYQDCIENSTGLFNCRRGYDFIGMETKSANLKTIEYSADRHFDKKEYLKHTHTYDNIKY